MESTNHKCHPRRVAKALAAAMLFTLFSLATSAQEAVLTKADYAKITYSWTDESGTTHENVPITEKASDPRQIIELLGTIYKDPRVPGPKYNAYDADGNRERETDYSNVTTNGWNVTGVQKPTKEGYTVLIVSVKNTWEGTDKTKKLANYKALVDYISKSIESVELITDGMRIGEGSNRGTLFNFSGHYNRFFFISKGQTRQNKKNVALAAFMQMYEQFSPTATKQQTGTSDFYAKLTSGEVYPVKHDCEGILDLDHYFCMAGMEGTTYYDMTGVNFFIPDHRMDFFGKKYTIIFGGTWIDDYRNDDGDSYVIYNTSHQPKTQMYTIKLTAEAQEASEQRKYNVTLNWTSNLNDLAGDVEQEYYIYRVVDGKVEEEPINKEPVYTTTWSETVDQQRSGYALTYVVKGRPKGATFNPIQSNHASVSIPGFDPMERLKLNIKGDFKSQYNQDTEYNNYNCTLQMNNGVGASVKRQYLDEGTEFTFLRSTGSENTPVATLKITSISLSWGSYKYSYTLTYTNQSEDGKSKARRNESGSFTAKSNDDIDFNNFSITDEFCASTKDNSQPDKYTYQVSFKPAVKIEGATGELVYSNSENVFVLKTTNDVQTTYTQSQVAADDNRTLAIADNGTVTFATAKAPSIFRYVVRRMQSDKGTEIIGQAQQTTEGSYALSELIKNDKGNYEMTSTGQTLAGGALATVTDRSLSAPSFAKYVPVIESYQTDKTQDKNTFGCDIKSLYSIAVGFNLENAYKSLGTFQGESDPNVKYRGFAAKFNVEPKRADNLKSYKFRIWRKIEDGNEVLLNNLTPATGDNWTIASDYDLIKAADGSSEIQDSKLTFADNFIAPEATHNVTYIIRYYAQDNAANAYYVAENEFMVNYDNVTPTQIDGVSATKEVSSVKYINTQGIQSDKAFRGINIVVTTYTDGTTATEKKVINR